VKIAISGASGFVGRRLLKVLGGGAHALHVLSRHAGTNLPPGVGITVWDPLRGIAPETGLAGVDAVIHLAGEPVAQRWTADVKRRIRESRVTGTHNLVEGMRRLSKPPAALICASAIGYYGSRGDESLTESAGPGEGFLPEVCVAWEREAVAAEALGVRVVRIRIGVVLDRNGGALRRMLPPFRLGLGGRLGSGRQYLSWIHLDDLAGMFRFALESQARGVWNGVAPNPVTNAEFTRTLAAALHRPAVFPVPGLALKALFGEMGGMLLDSQRVVPDAARAAGFPFRYPELGGAIAAAL
jgi:hypothetical protein